MRLASLEPCAIPHEDEALRAGVRAALHSLLHEMPAHQRVRSWMGSDPAFSRECGRRGWLGITFPREYGGGGRSAFARYVLVEEFLNAGAPVGLHWIADRQSGPLILKYGTESQKRSYLPRICSGDAFFCIGMSEPDAGSDLASVRTRAQRNEQGWLLNGQKIWTTHAHQCHYMIALVRTSGHAADRQQGLSQLIVDLHSPGVTIRPIRDLTGESHFNEVFFDNVQLAPEALVGEEGRGWEQVVAELAFERSGPERLYSAMVLFEQWLAFIRTPQGHSAASQRLAGALVSRLAALRAMCISLTGMLSRGASPVTEAALVKDLGTTVEQSMPALIADDLYSRTEVPIPMELMLTLQHATGVAPTWSLRGGTRDILRGMIARGLGLR